MVSHDLPPLPIWLDVSGLGPIAGRDAEMRAIDDAWDLTCGERRQVVLIGGPPGSGKSRLAAEVASAAHAAQAIVLYGACYPGYAPPFQPFLAILRGILTWANDAGDPDGLFEGAEALLDRFAPKEDQPTEGAEERDRHSQFERLVEILRQLADLAPVVVVIDDVHWASVPTLELLSHVVRSVGPDRVMLLVTFRSTLPERTPVLTEALVAMYSQPGVSRLDLEGLATSEVAQFLSSRTGTPVGELAAEAMRLRDRTGGNPFYMKEVWEAAIAGDKDGIPVAKMPATVADAVLNRIAALSGSGRETLSAAALATGPIDANLLAGVLDADSAQVRALLDAATAVGMVVSPGPNSYAFVHDLARDVVAEAVPSAERARWHSRYASEIEALSAGPEDAAGIAYHFARTGSEPAKAFYYARIAGEYAEKALAFEEAADHFDLAAANAADEADREEAVLQSAHNLKRGAKHKLAMDRYARVASSSDPHLRALAAIGFADASWRPGVLGYEPVLHLSAAIDRLAEEESGLMVEARAYLSRALGYAGAHDEALRVGNLALEGAKKLGDPVLVAKALLYPIYATPVVSQENLDRTIEASDIVAGLGIDDLAGQAAFLRGTNAYALGNRPVWLGAVRELVLVAERSRQPLHSVALAHATTSLAFCRGDYAEALAIADSSWQHAASFGADNLEGLHGVATFMVKRETGLEDIAPLITGDPKNEVGDWGLGLLAIYTELGKRDGAKVVLEELMETRVHGSEAWRYEGSLAAHLCEAVAYLGHKPYAEVLYETLTPRSGTNFVSGHFVSVFGSADRYLGMLAAVLGRDATEHFEKAIAMDTAMESVQHRAESLARYASWLRRRDPERAVTVGAEAMDTARRIGSVRIQRIAGALPGADSILTKRELEVLELVARGMTNRDISIELYISQNTAANHIRSILTKTGCDNRTQAARYAADHGLFSG